MEEGPEAMFSMKRPRWVSDALRGLQLLHRPSHVVLICALLLLPAVLGCVAYVSYRSQLRTEAHADLHVIAASKADLVASWVLEREGNARVLANDERLVADAGRLVRPGKDLDLSAIASHLDLVRRSYGYREAYLLDKAGLVRVRSGDVSAAVDGQALRSAIGPNRVGHGEMFALPSGEVVIDFVAALAAASGESETGGDAAGYVVLRASATKLLFPQILDWPMVSPTAEALLVRKVGDDVVFLNELRHRKNTALTLKRPLREADLPAAMALREGVAARAAFDGVDYRGVEVFASVAVVPRTDWILIAKVDRSEVNAPLVALGSAVTAVAMAALLAMAVLFAQLWRQQKRNLKLEKLAQSVSHDRLVARMFDQAYSGIAIGTADGNWLHVNNRLCRILDTERQKLEGSSWLSHLHADDHGRARAGFTGLVQGHIPFLEAELGLLTRNGESRLCSVYLECILNHAQAVDLVVFTITDVTEQRRAEAARQASERKFSALFESSPIGLIIAKARDEGGMELVSCNPAAERILCRGACDMVGRTIEEAFPPLAATDAPARYRNAALTGRTEHNAEIEYRDDRVSGFFEVYAFQVQPGILAAAIQDVTERRHITARLVESESRFRNLVESTGDWIWEVDADARYTYVSPQVQELLGYAPDEVLGKSPFDFMAPEEATRVGAEFSSIASLRKPVTGLRNVNLHRDGHPVTLETSGVPIFNGSGEFAGYRGIDRDVSWREAITEDLRASEQKYRALLEHAAEAVVIADLGGVILEVNAAAEQLLGYGRTELVGRNASVIHPEEDLRGLRAGFEALARSSGPIFFEGQAVTRNGRRVPVKVGASVIVVGGQRVVQGVFHDLSELRRLEAERLKVEAMHRESLIHEVHHRIKNNLQGVTGILSGLARNQPVLAPEIGATIGQIRSIGLVHGLFSRSKDGEVPLCELVNDIVRNVESLWQVQFDANIDRNCNHCIVCEKEAVPLALVLNELLANSCKHGIPGTSHTVSVEHAAGYASACVSIANHGQLPPGFDFPMQRSLGTGLGLVASLLPKEGAVLEWNQEESLIVTRLTLSAPVVADEPIPEAVTC